MKKFLMIAAMALMSVQLQAQSVGYTGYIDEIDLAGLWSVESVEGNIYGDTDFDYFNLNSYGYGKMYKGADTPLISSYAVTNSNKLHINFYDAPSWCFVILEYNSVSPRYMKLMTYDGKCTMEWKQTSSTNDVREMEAEKTGSDMFNLQGVKIKHPEGVYIQNGKKYVGK